jgi:four helix bundle protein
MIETNDDLERWRRAVDEAMEVCRTSGAFPRCETYTPHKKGTPAIADPVSSAKGEETLRRRELLQFLDHARASLLERQIQIKLASQLGLLGSTDEGKSTDVASEIAHLLDGLLDRFHDERTMEMRQISGLTS